MKYLFDLWPLEMTHHHKGANVVFSKSSQVPEEMEILLFSIFISDL